MPTTYAIPNGATEFAATTWTGDNTTPKSIVNGGNNPTGVTFQPDFVWLKSRSNAYQHNLYDSVRGAGSAYSLSSDGTAAQGGNSSTYGYLSAFNSTGFQVTQGSAGSGAAPNGNAYTNQTATTYVAWQWKAGGAAVSNTDGSITSQVSANTTAGFSVVTYTTNNTAGATIGHGLGVAPSMVICRSISTAASWAVYHASLGGTNWLRLNSTSGTTTSSQEWNNTNPSSTVVTLGGAGSNVNDGVGNSGLAYCWAEVAGYSKFGSYVGNGSSTDGPFVFTSMRPRWLMVKRTDTSGYNWNLYDTSRNPYNLSDLPLNPNTSDAESASTSNVFDILSNGFKVKGTSVATNASGGTYIYACFAENPFKYANAR